MKNKGLKNRFNKNELSSAWAYHFSCLWCGRAMPDAFHHIKSPSSSDYKKGNFNSSILNACLIHNHGCHLYNPELHKLETEKMLLRKVVEFLIEAGYKLKQKDIDFLDAYKELY